MILRSVDWHTIVREFFRDSSRDLDRERCIEIRSRNAVELRCNRVPAIVIGGILEGNLLFDRKLTLDLHCTRAKKSFSRNSSARRVITGPRVNEDYSFGALIKRIYDPASIETLKPHHALGMK